MNLFESEDWNLDRLHTVATALGNSVKYLQVDIDTALTNDNYGLGEYYKICQRDAAEILINAVSEIIKYQNEQ